MQGYEEKRVRELLKEHDGVLQRQNKHEIWKLSCGLIVLPSTPSDVRAWKNALSFLNNALGLNEERGIPGERREKKVKTEKPIQETALEAPELASMSSAIRKIREPKIKHPVHGEESHPSLITVDVSGLLTKFGGKR